MRISLPLILALPFAFSSPLARRNETATLAPPLPVVDEPVAGSWIVTLREDALLPTVLDRLSKIPGIRKKYTYDFPNFKGFVITGTSRPIRTLASIPFIKSIEQDAVTTTTTIVRQSKAPYGLARLSNRAANKTTYYYDDSAGAGTYAYVVDTGIYTTHNEFDGRAILGASFPDTMANVDGNGHGTHVAGTIGSKTYGVAKNTTLIAVKVLSDQGTGQVSDAIKGIEWAVNNATNSGRLGKSVINLSMACDFNQAINDAVAAAVKGGLFVAVGAGNNGAIASDYSPASEPLGCTTGAIDSNDIVASFSNYGPVVDLWAAGVGILSTYNSGPDALAVGDGTSCATPHVAGLGAYLLGLNKLATGKTATNMCDTIKNMATTNAVAPTEQQSSYNVAYNGWH